MADIDKVKRNISKMLAQNAPEADIDAYVASEGVTVADLQSHKPQQQATPKRDPKAEYDALPGWQKPIVAAVDMATIGLDGASFGYIPKGLAKLNEIAYGVPYEQALAQERRTVDDAYARAGSAGTVAGIGSMMLPAAKAAQAGATFARLPGMYGKLGGAALDGAAMGALDAHGHDQDPLVGAGLGLAGGAIGQAVASGASKAGGKIKGLLGGVDEAPSLEQLQAAKTAAYRNVDNAGGVYEPQQVDDLIGGISDEVGAANLSPMRHPKAASMLADIQSMKGRPLSFTELDQLRQTIGRDVAGSTDPAERFFGQKMIQNIDEFEAASGNTLSRDARAANAKFKKSEQVSNLLDKSERGSSASGSGGNIDNAIRRNANAILNNPKLRRSYSKEEIAALEKVVKGTKTQDALRLLGKLSPSGNGLMANLHTGAAVYSGGATLPLALLGYGSKALADRATKQNVDELLYLLGTGKVQPKGGLLNTKTTQKIGRMTGAAAATGLIGAN